MRKLCLADFSEIGGSESYWYTLNYNSGKEFERSSLHAWIFGITKSQVFDQLGWEQQYIKGSHQEYSVHFPVFDSKAKALIFLITAIALHNHKL